MGKQGMSLKLLGLVLATSTLMAACVVVPADQYYSGGPVMVAPPAPRVEYYGVAPAPGMIWLGGYWNWYGGRHVWVGGRWEAQRPGYGWVPHQWRQDGPGWRFAPGHWDRR